MSNEVKLIKQQTPQVLLSRDPSQLSRELNLPLDETLTFRAQVAAKVISKCRILRNRPENPFFHQEISGETPPPPQVPGFSTALDLCIQRAALLESLRKNGPLSSILKTGSEVLDILLSPSKNMVDGGPACTFHHSIVSRKIENHKRMRTNDEIYLTSPDLNPLQHVPYLHDIHEMVANHGLYPGTILEVSGPPSSGKTQLALTIVTNAILADKPWSVRYLVGGSVALTSLARRLRQICHSLANKNGLSKVAVDKLLDRVSFYPVSEMFQLIAVLTSIEEELDPPSESEHHNILVVLDSISAVFLSSAAMGNSSSDGGSSGALLSTVALTLRRLSRSGMIPTDCVVDFNCQHVSQCAIVVTNGTVSGWNKTSTADGHKFYSKAALGDWWKVADVRLAFEVEGDDYSDQDASSTSRISCNRKVRVHLTKHWLKKCNTPNSIVRIGLDRSGVVDVPKM